MTFDKEMQIREERINQMAKDLDRTGMLESGSRCNIAAQELVDAGWHKQSYGEWILVSEYGGGWYVGDKRVFPKYCSVCKATYTYGPYNYCPDCGSKMKGGK